MSHRLLVALLTLGVLLAACGPAASGPKTAPIVSSIPFRDGESLTYSIREDSGATSGVGTLTVRREGANLRIEQRYEEASPPAGAEANTDTTVVVANAETLQPASMQRDVAGRDASASFRAEYAADGKSVTVREGNEKPRTLPLPDVVYDNESSLWLWRTLALAEGFHARYVSVDAVGQSRQTVDLTVTGRQTVEVPAGRFEAWRLQVRSGRATRVAWINVEAPHEIVQWDNGSQLFRLERR